jgi:ComF family protein
LGTADRQGRRGRPRVVQRALIVHSPVVEGLRVHAELSETFGVEWLSQVADVVLGAQCAGCDNRAIALCPECSSEIRPRPATVREVPCRVVAAGEYDGALRSALIAWKEHGRFTVERPLAHLLAASIAALDPDPPIVLVPIPSRSDRRRARGADVVSELGRVAVRLLRTVGLEARVVPCLHLVRRVRDQAGLSAAERADNLRGAFIARRVSTARIVLIDDIVTTGATLSEAVRALSEAGGEVVGAATVAHRPIKFR